MFFGDVGRNERVSFPHVKRSCCGLFSFVFKRFNRFRYNVNDYSQECSSRWPFHRERFTSYTSNIVIFRPSCLICWFFVMNVESGSNSSALCLIRSQVSSQGSKKIVQLCDCGLCVKVLFFWSFHCSTWDTTYASSNGGSICLSIHIIPCFLYDNAYVNNKVHQIFRLSRGSNSQDPIARFLHFFCNSFRSFYAFNRCRLYSRNFWRILTFLTRNFKRNRCNFMAFRTNGPYWPCTNITTN